MPEVRRPTNSALGVLLGALAADPADPADPTSFAQAFVEGCLNTLAVDATSLLLADTAARAALTVASSDAAAAVVRAEIDAKAGPSIDCHRTSRTVRAHATRDAARWPSWSARMRADGLVFADAVPLQRDDTCIGVLTLLCREGRQPSADTLALAHALASGASAALRQREAVLRQADVIIQLQTALTSRVQIEQAKGILAERHGISVDDAFDALRRHARGHGRRLHDVAQDIIERGLNLPYDATDAPRAKG